MKPTQAPPERKRQKALIIALGVIAVATIAFGSAIALRGIIHPEEQAGASTTDNSSAASPFDTEADNAMDYLTINKSVMDDDMSVLTTMLPSLDIEYEQISQSQPDVPSPHDVITQLPVNSWEKEIAGWEYLQLRVRAGEYAINALQEEYQDEYEVISSEIPAPIDANAKAPESVMLVCQCVSGENTGITLTVTVGLMGSTPTVADNMDAVLSQKIGVLERLNAVIGVSNGLYVGDFALEGYTVPLRNEDGMSARTESWWLYVNSNVAPTDVNDFVTFVNDMFLAFQKTAGADVVNIDLTVISCDATDPAMQGKTFSELATELAVTNDHGGFYMNFDYPLRGQATTNTPCHEEDLDGRLHPYKWDI